MALLRRQATEVATKRILQNLRCIEYLLPHCAARSRVYFEKLSQLLATARTQVAADRNSAVGDPEGPPRALQTSECSELLNPTRTSCLILAQRQPGKLPYVKRRGPAQ